MFEAVHRGEQPVDVAGQCPAVRQQVVGQQHGLGALHVGVAGQVDVGRIGGPLRQRVLERHDLVGHADEGAPAPQAQRGRHLVVAAPPGVQLGADVADELGDAPLDRGVDVLVARREGEHAGGELLLHHVQRVDRVPSTSASERMPTLPSPFTCAREPARSSVARTWSKGRLTVNAATSSAIPAAMRPSHSVMPRPFLVLVAPAAPARSAASARSAPRPSAPGPCLADHVATPRPHSRTNPSASPCRKVSDAS